MSVQVAITQLSHGRDLPLPEYATAQAAGLDLMAAVEGDLVLRPMQRYLVPTGIAIALPAGYEAQIRPRSGLALKHGIGIVNSPGTIDADYRGEIKILLINMGSDPYTVTRGARIAQMVIAPVTHAGWQVVESLDESVRGASGFGSTGVHSSKESQQISEPHATASKRVTETI